MTPSKVATDMRIFHLSGPPKHGPQKKLATQIPDNARIKMIARAIGQPLNHKSAQIPKTATTQTAMVMGEMLDTMKRVKLPTL